jgi:membrane fusion protein (multidrug efflux system)
MKKSSKIALSSVALVGIASLVVAPRVLSGKNEAIAKTAPPAAQTAMQAVTVDGYVVSGASVDELIQAVGTISAYQSVAIVSEVARKVTQIHAKEGSAVQKGTLLFKLDDADLRARKQKLVLQEKLAILDEKRFRELLATESVNQQEYDQISTTLQVLQADIQLVNVDLAKTELRAPFAGKIGLTKVDVGALVTPNTVLTSLQDVSQVEVRFTVPEKYAGEIKAGQRIRFTTENGTRTYEGRITATEPQTDLNTRSLDVLAVSENKDGRLVPGVSAKIDIQLKEIQNSISIPTQALLPTPKGYSLFAVKDGKAELREVKTGNRTKATVQILEGVAVGDTIITTNFMRIGPGVPVQIAKAL